MSLSVTIVLAIISSNALFGFVQFIITHIVESKSLTRKTLGAVCYNQLADKIEKSLDRDYATPEQRRDVTVLYEAYKKNGWNGDMDSRMEKFYCLPTKDLNDVYK